MRGQSNRKPEGRWWWLCLCLFWWPVLLQAADVEIRGVSGALRENVEAYVGKVGDEELKAWRGTRDRLLDRVTAALRTMGHYNPAVDIGLEGRQITIAIAPGQPVRVRNLRLVFEGDAADDEAFAALRGQLPLQEGQPFHHGRYEALKTAVSSLGVERGYFDADWRSSEVLVDPEGLTADVNLVFASGPRYRFGPVRFLRIGSEEPQTLVEPELLEQLVPFEEGQPYLAGDLIRFNRDLLDTRYFGEVSVEVERERAEGNVVPLEVGVAAQKPNNVDIGIGYSTDVEARLTLKWRRPLVNRHGHSFETNAELSPVRSSLDARYTVPLSHPLNDTLQYSYGVKREEVEEVVIWNTVLGLQRQTKSDNGWTRIYSLRALRDTNELPSETLRKDLVLPGISFDRLRSKGGVDPYWGDRQFYQVEVASEDVLSDASLAIFRTGFRYLRTLAQRHQFLLRADGGVILTDSFEDVPLSMRFFAGGDQSVRGYAYRSISPRNEDGAAIGARNLVTGSAEYSYEFIPRWRAALFTDAGNAFNASSEPFKVGAGAGVRWVSPVGPIRLDVAWPVSETERDDFRIHVSLGASL